MTKEYKTSEAKREYAKQYYYDNIERHKTQRSARAKRQYAENPAYFNERNAERRKMLTDIIQQQKVGKSCTQCGISDPRMLDFHHLDSSTKGGNIAKAVGQNWSVKRLLQEIAKCETVCANCHRILHWEERNGKDSSS